MYDKVCIERNLSVGDIIESLCNLKQLIFEVTDVCNLRCKYCGYGDLYFGYDQRNGNYLPIKRAKAVIDYLVSYWAKYKPKAQRPLTYISFYGGEPLLNIPFVKAIVEYVESLSVSRTFVFSMTTNAVLLDRYMDYLAEKKFRLLISLDGDRNGNGYRVTPSGTSSFEKVYSNAKHLQQQYPSYFDECVNFNSVLHSLNGVEQTYSFIHSNFGKTPTISELNNSHIRKEKKEFFNLMYKNKFESISSSFDSDSLSNALFLENAETYDLHIFLRQNSGNIYQDYEELLVSERQMSKCPTGTCVPFSRKMFVTVNGKILQCEKIAHDYALGYVSEDSKVTLDVESIVARINGYYDKFRKRCAVCAKKVGCTQCMYFVDNIDGDNPICQGFCTQEEFNAHTCSTLGYLSRHPELYDRLTSEVEID